MNGQAWTNFILKGTGEKASHKMTREFVLCTCTGMLYVRFVNVYLDECGNDGKFFVGLSEMQSN